VQEICITVSKISKIAEDASTALLPVAWTFKVDKLYCGNKTKQNKTKQKDEIYAFQSRAYMHGLSDMCTRRQY
jgi:hypothetical protein